jgi:hypothetical protein
MIDGHKDSVRAQRVLSIWADHLSQGSFVFADGHLHYVCPCGCGFARAVPVNGERGWKWDGNEDKPTLDPSIRHVGMCRWHGFLRNGMWEPAGDSGQ